MTRPLSIVRALLAALLLCSIAPAYAGNKLIVAGVSIAVAKSAMTVTPEREWNKMGARPGRNSETWTLDGDTLNDLTFYGGIANDATLFREVNKRSAPLPRFSSTMLLTDIPVLLENSYRIALNTSLMAVDSVTPTTFAGEKAIHFTYSFTNQDGLRRNGEGTAAIIAGKLYMITFEAPVIHYFARDVASYHQVVASVRFPAVAKRK